MEQSLTKQEIFIQDHIESLTTLAKSKGGLDLIKLLDIYQEDLKERISHHATTIGINKERNQEIIETIKMCKSYLEAFKQIHSLLLFLGEEKNGK
jgi:hypothetical protein